MFAISNDIPQVLPSNITWTFTSSLSGLEAEFDDSADPRFDFSSDMLTLTVTSASLLDDGVYAVRASNPAGYNKDNTRVTVYGERRERERGWGDKERERERGRGGWGDRHRERERERGRKYQLKIISKFILENKFIPSHSHSCSLHQLHWSR